jgi:hypothetical protein
MKLFKGDIVEIKRHLIFSQIHNPGERKKRICEIKEFPVNKVGIIIGATMRFTGTVDKYDCGNEDEPYMYVPYLKIEDKYPVYIIEPLNTNRYLQPLICREEDIELAEGNNK